MHASYNRKSSYCESVIFLRPLGPFRKPRKVHNYQLRARRPMHPLTPLPDPIVLPRLLPELPGWASRLLQAESSVLMVPEAFQVSQAWHRQRASKVLMALA